MSIPPLMKTCSAGYECAIDMARLGHLVSVGMVGTKVSRPIDSIRYGFYLEMTEKVKMRQTLQKVRRGKGGWSTLIWGDRSGRVCRWPRFAAPFHPCRGRCPPPLCLAADAPRTTNKWNTLANFMLLQHIVITGNRWVGSVSIEVLCGMDELRSRAQFEAQDS